MADESVRSLLATLGFEVDNTAADQFEARFKKLESTVRTIAKRIDAIKPKFDKKRGKKAGFSFGKALKKAIVGGFESVKFKPGKQITKSLKAGLKKAFKAAKVIAIAGAAALAAAAGKGLLRFTDIESAEAALTFKAEKKGVDFLEIKKQLDAVRKSTGDVVDELEVLQALDIGFELTGDFKGVADNMGDVIKFSRVLNKDLAEVQTQFSTFIKTGGNLDELKKFGFFDQKQIEALKRSGTGFGPLAEETRARQLSELIAAEVPRLEKAFNRYNKSNAAFIDKSTTLLQEKTAEFGEDLTRRARNLAARFGIIPDPRGISETIENKILRPRGTGVGTFTPETGIGGPPNRRLINQSNTVNQNNTVNVNGGNTEEVRRVVGEVIQDAARIEIRKTSDIGLPVNEVPE